MNTKQFTILSDEKNWMEGNAIKQAKHLLNLSGVESVTAMPDLHMGKTPVGVVVVTSGQIYPHLIGTDIGCGMSVFSTNLDSKRIKLEKWTSTLNTIKTLAVVPNSEYFENCPIPDYGSIGSGNHFAEFEVIENVYDEELLNNLQMKKGELYLTVHSGSRSYGSKILSQFNQYDGYEAQSDNAKAYLNAQADALYWACKNRNEVAQKLITFLGYGQQVEKKLECNHNFLEESDGFFYHRKGAVSSRNGAVIIAGSRGSFSYLVKPTDKCAEYGYTLAHGAGRKWARSMCKSRIKNKYTPATIKQNKFGGQLVCHDYDLLFEEAPDAYKNIENIISNLQNYGMIELIASLKPMLTFKG